MLPDHTLVAAATHPAVGMLFRTPVEVPALPGSPGILAVAPAAAGTGSTLVVVALVRVAGTLAAAAGSSPALVLCTEAVPRPQCILGEVQTTASKAW